MVCIDLPVEQSSWGHTMTAGLNLIAYDRRSSRIFWSFVQRGSVGADRGPWLMVWAPAKGLVHPALVAAPPRYPVAKKGSILNYQKRRVAPKLASSKAGDIAQEFKYAPSRSSDGGKEAEKSRKKDIGERKSERKRDSASRFSLSCQMIFLPWTFGVQLFLFMVCSWGAPRILLLLSRRGESPSDAPRRPSRPAASQPSRSSRSSGTGRRRRTPRARAMATRHRLLPAT